MNFWFTHLPGWCALAVLTYSANVSAQLKFALIGKTKNDSFYQQSLKGCQAFSRTIPDLTCVYDGADDYQDVRTQVLIVKEYINKGIDGLLISTTDSRFLVSGALQLAKEKNIPVITFDSDLLEQHQTYRLAYVGTNNFDFGVALGKAALKYKTFDPQPFCIQSGHQTTPNLNKRIEGVRYALSGSASTRLNGQSGWIEYDRCPLYTMGRRDDSLNQLLTILDYKQPPIFLAVAGFAQFNPEYSIKLLDYKQRIKAGDITIISADTEQIQLQALSNGLSSINIGQNPHEMGRLSAELLYRYVKSGEKPKKSTYYLDFHYCNQENVATCTVNY
ncbi:substrate-binding domain-containing protein [Pseudoalteromonas sp. SMS1]|uniref:substrate-binding domain-containing protein n=1 Tax=Pseudoalteromonas sp. SMS1 TaxID=2908894 RepID=UPI001F288A4C|nr:substrate-binding domain-containing protein [Pseudoalteromonas sp. SMS1]MCF2855889.1 substrate-binding domain-containing protein [Pseudoalteromonas sp. SMS1]